MLLQTGDKLRAPRPTETGAGQGGGATAEPAGRTTTPWQVLCPPGAVHLEATQPSRRLPDLAPGTPVVLYDGRPLSRRRLRALAAKLQVVPDRELILLPTPQHPLFVVDDTPSAVHHLWRSVVTVPPGLAATALPAAAALRLIRVLPWTWTGAIAPGRVLIGRRR